MSMQNINIKTLNYELYKKNKSVDLSMHISNLQVLSGFLIFLYLWMQNIKLLFYTLMGYTIVYTQIFIRIFLKLVSMIF